MRYETLTTGVLLSMRALFHSRAMANHYCLYFDGVSVEHVARVRHDIRRCAQIDRVVRARATR